MLFKAMWVVSQYKYLSEILTSYWSHFFLFYLVSGWISHELLPSKKKKKRERYRKENCDCNCRKKNVAYTISRKTCLHEQPTLSKLFCVSCNRDYIYTGITLHYHMLTSADFDLYFIKHRNGWGQLLFSSVRWRNIRLERLCLLFFLFCLFSYFCFLWEYMKEKCISDIFHHIDLSHWKKLKINVLLQFWIQFRTFHLYFVFFIL